MFESRLGLLSLGNRESKTGFLWLIFISRAWTSLSVVSFAFYYIIGCSTFARTRFGICGEIRNHSRKWNQSYILYYIITLQFSALLPVQSLRTLMYSTSLAWEGIWTMQRFRRLAKSSSKAFVPSLDLARILRMAWSSAM